MPSIGAALVAMMAGWLVDALFRPLLGTGLTLLLSFIFSTFAFFIVRARLKELRD